MDGDNFGSFERSALEGGIDGPFDLTLSRHPESLEKLADLEIENFFVHDHLRCRIILCAVGRSSVRGQGGPGALKPLVLDSLVLLQRALFQTGEVRALELGYPVSRCLQGLPERELTLNP